MKLRQPCLTASCGALTDPGRSYCPGCLRARDRAVEAARPSRQQRGYDADWRKVRLVVLERDRWTCRWCGGRADTVDHVHPLNLGGARLDPANLVAACRPCNSARAAQARR